MYQIKIKSKISHLSRALRSRDGYCVNDSLIRISMAQRHQHNEFAPNQIRFGFSKYVALISWCTPILAKLCSLMKQQQAIHKAVSCIIADLIADYWIAYQSCIQF